MNITSFKPLIVASVLYVTLLLLLDRLSDGWNLPAIVIMPIVLVGELIFITAAPIHHRRLFSMLLLGLSILLLPVAAIAASFLVDGFIGEPAGYAVRYRELLVLACFLPSIFGISQAIYLKATKRF